MSWPLVNLSTVCQIDMGSAPKGSTYVELDSGVPLIAGAADYGDVFPRPKKATLEPTKLCKKGDIIICVRATIGDLNWADKEYCLGRGVAGLRAHDEKLDSKYLWYFIASIEDELYRNSTGSTFPQINKKVIESLEIPLPPLETQKQIAAVLEKADQLRKDCQQMEQELNSLAQSVFIEMFGDPVTNPKGWIKQSLKSISSKFHDGPFGSNLKTSHYTDSGVQVIRLKNIGSGEFKEADKAFVSEAHAETLHKFKCYPGEIVIATLGEPNLRACIIPDSVPVAINKADCVHCVVDSSVINSHYLVEYLNLPSVLHTIQNKLHGQTRTRISSGQLATVDVVIPPLEQQAKYLEVLALRAKLKMDNNRSVHECREFFNGLMQKAFKGELNL
ncbi:type I restriction modification enzyme protein S [Vibrio zhanjiangensis]|uniref:Type I restriction modification enzyme protein S n=1 Tax=Vibrio zhanjiangensis TaxID=1046128 RepID=A0ABQ6F015_9VIBR|nr:restriction endonuclease subunit S [Vibrio zhanjiangensis]GLT18554.1 type I restriction modification enzyme protein S [Vibrio zhanjiangensis]